MEIAEPSNPTADIVSALTAPILRQIREPDGFTKSFTIDQRSEYLQFFSQWGFVVIRDVLTQQVRTGLLCSHESKSEVDSIPYLPSIVTFISLTRIQFCNARLIFGLFCSLRVALAGN